MTTERAFLGVWIPKEIYLHKGLTPTEKLLLAEVYSFSKNGICFASNEHFSEFLGISKRQVSRLISNLNDTGLIKVDLIYKEGTKEVDKRLITPIDIDDHTPGHSRPDPQDIHALTPRHSRPDPHGVDVVDKEHLKNQFKDQEKDLKNIKKVSAAEVEREFDQLWQLYPRKIGRKKAFDSYKKARKTKKIPFETIQNGLYRYIKHLETSETEEQYIMHGSTWFNQEKWQDEYITTGISRKPKNAMEYMRQKYGTGEIIDESNRNRKIINDFAEIISEPF